jgi:hypothetical protein
MQQQEMQQVVIQNCVPEENEDAAAGLANTALAPRHEILAASACEEEEEE